MRFIYARCEIHIQRHDIHKESIQDRHDIDIRFIDDVYESTWHWYTTYQYRYALHIRSMWNPYTAIWRPYETETSSIWHRYTIYRRRIWIDMALIHNLSKIDMRFTYARCEINIQRYDSNIASMQDRYDIDIQLIDDVYASAWHWYTIYQIDMRFIYALCEIHIQRYDIDI